MVNFVNHGNMVLSDADADVNADYVILDVYVDTKEHALWYGMNGKDYGIARGIDKDADYVLAVALYGPYQQVQILGCTLAHYGDHKDKFNVEQDVKK